MFGYLPLEDAVCISARYPSPNLTLSPPRAPLLLPGYTRESIVGKLEHPELKRAMNVLRGKSNAISVSNPLHDKWPRMEMPCLALC